MALTDKLTAIGDAIRGKTGGTDPLSLAAMAEAIAGIKTDSGSTGSSGGVSGIYTATITPAEDTNMIQVDHMLKDDVLAAFLYAEDYTISVLGLERSFPVMMMYIKTDLDVYNNSSSYLNAFVANNYYSYTSGYVTSTKGYTSSTYAPTTIDSNSFLFRTANTQSSKFIAGQTLNVVIIATNAGV